MDLQTAKELDKVFNKIKPNGIYISDATFKYFNLRSDYKEYMQMLKSREFIRFNHEASGPTEKPTGYYLVTALGKTFGGFEKEFLKQSNWFKKDNYTNAKWLITTLVFVAINVTGWIIAVKSRN